MSQKQGKQVNPVSYLFGKMWRYSEGRRKNIVSFWTLFTLSNAINLICQPLIWAKIINIVQIEGVSNENIGIIIKLLMCTMLVESAFWILHGPGRVMEQSNAFWACTNYRKWLLQGVMTQSLDWHSEHHSGDTIDKVGKGTEALLGFSENSYLTISTIVQLLISYSMLAYYCHSSAIIVLVMIVIAIWITMRFDRTLVDQYGELNHAYNQISAKMFDAISNITTIVILRTEKLVFNSIMKKVVSPFKLFRKNVAVNECKWFLTSMVCSLMTVVVIGAYFLERLISHQKILLGIFFLLLKYLEKISDLFFRFANDYSVYLKQKAKILNSEELTEDFKSESFTNHILPANWESLDIKGLHFSYNEESSELDLSDVSLTLVKGERIAFVGESGSGKSTLLKVIRDLYHPQKLNLSVDGKTISDGFGGIARAITLIPQDPEIFATTILENITMGADYDINEVNRFIDLACFTDVVELLPKKLYSSIKEKGVNLSGGQQQRLALSRGLLACSDKDIVLLDEPTNSTDAINEMKIYQNIFKEFKGKTIISSLHGLHLLPLFDKVYVFDKGKIVGSGTLSEVLSSCHQFQNLWQQISDTQG